MQLYLILFIIAFYVNLISCQSSRCPEFEFDNAKNEVGKYYGELTLTSDINLTGVWIEIILNEQAELLGSTFSEITTTDNLKFKLQNPEYILKTNQELKIPIFVKYNDVAPVVDSIRLNARTICPEQPVSYITKCPGIFYFDKNNPEYEKLWYGTMKISSEFDLTSIWIQVFLDSPAELFGAAFGEVETKNNQEFLIRDSNYTLKRGGLLKIPIFAKYANLPDVPNIKFIRLNGRTICGNTDLGRRHQLSTSTEPLSVLPQTYQALNNSESDANPLSLDDDYKNVECGTIDLQDRILFGLPSTITLFPWHGAIFVKQGNNAPTYICGMTLISRRHAITAAHCFYDQLNKLRDIRQMQFYFGVENLNQLNTAEVQNPKMQTLSLGLDYEFPKPKNDIAIIKFQAPLKFSKNVRPACLWEEDINLGTVDRKFGTVIGYGLTETGRHSNTLRFSEILVVDNESCRELNPTFYTILNRNSFCAGNLRGSSVCQGDSGGGMYFRKNGRGRWQIRGIVSTARRLHDSCDNSHYAIFTDVAKFKYWIEEIIKK